MATATCRRRSAWGAATVAAAAIAAAAALLGAVAPRSAAAPHRAAAATPPAWPHPSAAPAGWAHASTADGDATLFYPPSWKDVPGDRGTVSVALRDAAGDYLGYLNVTPRQGDERLSTWPAFRLGRNREEGDTGVHALASAHHLRFRDAVAACVIDDYRSRVGGHAYRELACLVSGAHATDVFIGATAQRDWTSLGTVIQRSAASFVQR